MSRAALEGLENNGWVRWVQVEVGDCPVRLFSPVQGPHTYLQVF